MSQTVLNNLVTFLLPCIGIAMVIFIAIEGFKIYKGAEGASIKKLILGILVFLALGGLMILAKNFTKTADTASTLIENIGDGLNDEAGKLIK